MNADLEILDAFWDPKILAEEGDFVPPLLAYADLLGTTDGRNLEAAKLIYDRHRAPSSNSLNGYRSSSEFRYAPWQRRSSL